MKESAMTSTDLHDFWQQTLADWTASGLSGAAFWREHTLSYYQFSYWRTKLRAQGESQAGAGFARVASVPGSDNADGLTVSLPGGVSITGQSRGTQQHNLHNNGSSDNWQATDIVNT